jgi:hypothetical protein
LVILTNLLEKIPVVYACASTTGGIGSFKQLQSSLAVSLATG